MKTWMGQGVAWLLAGLLTVGSIQVLAAPGQVATAKDSSPHTRQSPFGHPGDLTVQGVKLGMTRDDVHHLRLSREDWPSGLQFNRDGHVTFVSGSVLAKGKQELGRSWDPIQAQHLLGTPVVKQQIGNVVLCAYRCDSSLVLFRYYPASLDSRRGATGDMAIATDVSAVPAEWNPSVLVRAGL